MTVEQAIEAAELIEKMKRLDGALGYIETFEEKIAGRLPSCCSLEIGGSFLRSKVDGIPKEIALEMMEHLKNSLEAERFSVATKLGKM